MNTPIFYSDISTRRVFAESSGGLPSEQIDSLCRRVQAQVPFFLEDAWKYGRQDSIFQKQR